MAIVMKEKASVDIPNPDTGKSTFFLDTGGIPKAKNSSGSVSTLQGPQGTAGTNGTNGTNGAPGAQGPPGVVDYSGFVIEDDFASSSELTRSIGKHSWQIQAGGTGNNQTRISGEAGHPGIFRLQGGSVAIARSAITLGEAGMHCLVLGTGPLTFEGVFRLGGVQNTHLQSAIGLGDSFVANGDQLNGVYLRITATGNWFLVSSAAGVQTTVDLGLAHNATTWFRAGFTINSAATSIQGHVGGVDTGSAITTNIPVLALSPFAKTDAIVGGVAIPFDIDKYYLTQTISPLR